MPPEMISITVPSAGSTSLVWVGNGIIPNLASLLHTERYSQTLVVGDLGASSIVPLVSQALGSSYTQSLLLEGGEGCKSLLCLTRLWDFFSESKLDRKGLVVAIGGGALSDLVGFAAATYMRGVAFVVIPTTLLAQVDAGIGGKSGINYSGVKNLLGSIAQPIGIVIDITSLKTLPKREICSGFAEIIKHGLIADRAYFELVTSRDYSDWTDAQLSDIVFRSCQIKCSIVEQDPSEQGIRRSLNFGHTLGHAVEAYALKTEQPLTHGEAVAIGMNAACFISHRMGLLSEVDWKTSVAGIKRAGLSLLLPRTMEPKELLDLISLDKKNVGGVPRWTLLTGVGSVVIDQNVPLDIVLEAISHIQPL